MKSYNAWRKKWKEDLTLLICWHSFDHSLPLSKSEHLLVQVIRTYAPTANSIICIIPTSLSSYYLWTKKTNKILSHSESFVHEFGQHFISREFHISPLKFLYHMMITPIRQYEEQDPKYKIDIKFQNPVAILISSIWKPIDKLTFIYVHYTVCMEVNVKIIYNSDYESSYTFEMFYFQTESVLEIQSIIASKTNEKVLGGKFCMFLDVSLWKRETIFGFIYEIVIKIKLYGYTSTTLDTSSNIVLGIFISRIFHCTFTLLIKTNLKYTLNLH